MEGDSPPLWAQSTTAFLPHHHHRRRSSAPILNPVVLILLIPTLFLLLLFFLLPPFLSHTSEFLRAGTVKKSWDSFNVLLVICAILCGVFARRNDDTGSATTTTTDNNHNHTNSEIISNAAAKSHSSASNQWFVQDHHPSPMITAPATGSTGRLRRSSSSYPDLRHESLWEPDESRFRFFDDFDLNHYRAPTAAVTSRHLPARRTSGDTGDRDDFLVKEIPVDSFVVHPTPRPPSPPENQPQPANQVQRRTFQSVPREEEEIKLVEQNQFQFKIQTTTIPESDQPPSPLVTIANHRTTQERKLKRSDRKKSGSAKEIATAIASSLYSQRKRKRRTRTRNIYDIANESTSPLFQQDEEQPPPQTAAAPPPPPPPPPPSFFQNIFKKGSKTKRVHSVSVSVSTPPPPPPPPPRSLFNNLLKTGVAKGKRFQSAASPPPPPPPPSSIFNNIFKSNAKSKRFNSISTPPPPPLPPPPSSTFRNMFRTSIKNKRFDPISKYPPSSDQSFEESRSQSPRLHTPPPSSDSPRRRNPSAGRPPLPTKMNQYYDGNETINSGAQSPLIRIPSPPPLPPFKIPEMKFFARGDFVRIRSTHSSRCSSPGLDDVDFLPSRSSDATEGGGIQGSITSTCPSPDVNLKADSFIARLRGEWKIELMNSVNERRKMAQQP